MAVPGRPAQAIRFGDFEVDLRAGQLRKRGLRIKLQEQPFQILVMMLERPGEVVRREELRQRLWASDTFVDFDHGLNNAVNRLREALNDSPEAPRFIATLPRRGYSFIAKVKACVSTPSEALALSDSVATKQTVAPSERRVPPRPSQVPSLRPGRRIALALASAALAGVLILWLYLGRQWPLGSGPGLGIQSIAVLPLENLSGDPSQEYFVDGMTDALITDLAQIRGLRVISRTSTMQYKGSKKRLPQIARELKVDTILEGSVVRSNDQVRIDAQLIRAANDQHLWAKYYQSHLSDVVNMQNDIARAVAEEVQLQITPEEKTRLMASRPANSEAYEAYLKGLYLQNRQAPDDIQTAIRFFQVAIDKDPGYAVAYAQLANCVMFLGATGQISSAEASSRASEAAHKALALDERLEDAHIDVANIAFFRDWDWGKADREFRRAGGLNPNSARIHQAYAPILQILGRTKEAAAEVRAARALEPVSLSTLVSGIVVSYFARQYDSALEQARTALEVYPDAPLLHVFLSNIYFQQPQSQQAAEESLRAEELWHASPERIAALRAALKTAGLKGFLRRRIQINKKQLTPEFQQAYDIAIDCAALGDWDQSIYWLEKAYRVRDPKLPLLGVEPIFDGLRSDPRFQGLLRRIGLPMSVIAG